MNHLVFYLLVHVLPLGALCELILSEEALGELQLSDLRARADLVEELTMPSVCKRQVRMQQSRYGSEKDSRCITIGWNSLVDSTRVRTLL